MIEALEIDPFDSDHWLYGTGLTLYGGHDLTKWDTTHNITISSLAVGIEEMAVLGLASPPNGTELLAAVGDDCGFTYKSTSDLGTAPQTPWMTPIWTSTTDVGECTRLIPPYILHPTDMIQTTPATSPRTSCAWATPTARRRSPSPPTAA
jgi:hypothetical protein